MSRRVSVTSSAIGGPGDGRSEAAPFTLGYRPALDGMRGLAILAVLAFHLGIATTLPRPPFSGPTHVALSFLFHAQGGYVGVQLFFVLSGFLITALLVAEGQQQGSVSLRRFYERRALRLFPALFVLVAACAVYAWAAPSAPEAAGIGRDSFATLLYFANWSGAASPRFVEHLLSQTWSLSIEEQFYVIWPIALVLLMRRFRRPAVFAITTIAACVSWAERSVLWHHGASATRVYYGLDTRGDALLFGCALGLAAAWGWLPTGTVSRLAARGSALAGAVFLAAVVVMPGRLSAVFARGEFDWLLSVTAIAAGAIVLTVVTEPDSRASRTLAHPVLVWVGRLSYSLYLWHFPVFMVLTASRTGLTLLPLLVVRLVAAFAFAAGSYYAIERPFLRLKARVAGRVRSGDTRGSRRQPTGQRPRTDWEPSAPAPSPAASD